MPDDHLHNIRHSFAHVLAAAVLKLFPDAKLGVGPVIDNGCFYDFLLSRPLSPADLPKIEKEMRKIISRNLPFERQEMTSGKAKMFFADLKQMFKVELIRDIERYGTTALDNIQRVTHETAEGKETVISLYKTGGFVDLCRGGHVENTNELNIDAFKVDRASGAYWRGSQEREQLQRIYVLAFEKKKDLDAFLKQREEAEKRDHKKLGTQLDLFVFSEMVGPGLPLWTPKGTLLRNLLDEFVWELRKKAGYERVEIPHITKKILYTTSGHWDKFKEELFRITTREKHEFAMKPMNCPHHTQIYARRPWSWRELPQRYANTTMCYRDEQTGELSGLTRARSFTQDDAHVFCRMAQIETELLKIWDIVHSFYGAFGFTLRLRLSLHDPKRPTDYLGDIERWAKAEAMLRSVAKKKKTPFAEAPGEAAFYGPKLDFLAKDSLGREWQVATIQLDMNMPDRFDLTCTAEDGKPERIVMIHAAIMGSLERFLSIIIEHYAGAFPLWLAPVQVAVLPIGKAHKTYAAQIDKALKAANIRTLLRSDDETIGKKIRESELQKIPHILIMGDKEKSKKTVAVRQRGKGDMGTTKLVKFLKKIGEEVSKKK